MSRRGDRERHRKYWPVHSSTPIDLWNVGTQLMNFDHVSYTLGLGSAVHIRDYLASRALVETTARKTPRFWSFFYVGIWRSTLEAFRQVDLALFSLSPSVSNYHQNDLAMKTFGLGDESVQHVAAQDTGHYMGHMTCLVYGSPAFFFFCFCSINQSHVSISRSCWLAIV